MTRFYINFYTQNNFIDMFHFEFLPNKSPSHWAIFNCVIVRSPLSDRPGKKFHDRLPFAIRACEQEGS